jgi:hypothetical protein
MVTIHISITHENCTFSNNGIEIPVGNNVNLMVLYSEILEKIKEMDLTKHKM